MTLRDFIKLYNFRNFHNDKQNTQIIRIYTEFPEEWFEFGVNDWSYDDSRDKLVDKFVNKNILNQEVTSVNYDDVNDVFCIHVEEKTE